ncbi:hypothetical protein GGS21DRAFT_540356 [Xylaria nigripes]|nr:hypothetical protein GGS21DRAFT_540356 [Xylaria nigripes]
MAGRARLRVGSGPWIVEERSSAMQIAASEVEEFTFSVQNDFDWLNEHMAQVFSENQIDVAEIFKTPGKLRGKTPRTIRKGAVGENRVPLSNIFSSTPQGGPNPFSMQNHGKLNTPRVKIAADPLPSPTKAAMPTSPLKRLASPIVVLPSKQVSMVDSGYHKSQTQDSMEVDDGMIPDESTQPSSPKGSIQSDDVASEVSPIYEDVRSPAHPSPDLQREARDDELAIQQFTIPMDADAASTNRQAHESTTPAGSPVQSLLSDVETGSMPADIPESSHTPSAEPPSADPDAMETALDGVSPSPSDGSSPIRPIVRKSSLNFASLPAREPINHKSIGNRVSRTSHLDQNRTSYYRHTGGKSLGRTKDDLSDNENDNMDVDHPDVPPKTQSEDTNNAVTQNKTYTQRLQDQISKLGKSQVNVQQSSKGNADSAPDMNALAPPTPLGKTINSPLKTTTPWPGAFPEDDDDDWIEPLGTPDDASNFKSPHFGHPKSYTNVMEAVAGKETASEEDFVVRSAPAPTGFIKSSELPPVAEKAADVFAHRSGSDTAIPVNGQNRVTDNNDQKKATLVSNSTELLVPREGQPTTPKSPTRALNNSPLKQVKDKLSSILKGSRGLLASSAAISAEGKSSILPPTARLCPNSGPSTEFSASPSVKESQLLYPDLSRQVAESQKVASTASPKKSEGRRTRSSVEREKAEERRKNEIKEAQQLAEQKEKLENEHEKECEQELVLGKEQERIAAMEKEVIARKQQEKRNALATPGNIPRAAKISPRKVNPPTVRDGQRMDGPRTNGKTTDVDMTDAPDTVPPPTISRPAAPSSAIKPKELKRPIRPTKEPTGKLKQAPTVIRVNMGSQHSQYQPSGSAFSSSLHDSQRSKASQPSLQAKASLQSLKNSTSSVTRPKALEIAARRKEQEEREAQRKRDAKAEMDRKRAAMQEEEKRQEQERKLEAERQKDEERKLAAMQAEAKKNAQRQAMLEKAKQTRAPPPAVRNQPGGPPDNSRNEAGSSRPPSRMNLPSRSQDDTSRPVNAVLSTGTKSQAKRPLQQENGDDNTPRTGQNRNGNGLQPKESKRMRMTDELNDTVGNEKQPNLKGAPVRPSGGIKKDLPPKSIFAAGYTNAPGQGVTRDLFKATVTNQHNSHIKAAHPLDMAQLSKGAIPFAPSKTPARAPGTAATKSAAKSATRSSPRFQNGESIELPEINSDDEDDEDEEESAKGLIAEWADSPNLRRALVEQENRNPFEVFGAPAPLNMEEVFARNKDRFPKFRARTSSANWSGPDGLSEEDIRKDLAAREKMRREGGWSYDMGREMV